MDDWNKTHIKFLSFIGVLLIIGFWSGIGYVIWHFVPIIWHFVSKVW